MIQREVLDRKEQGRGLRRIGGRGFDEDCMCNVRSVEKL